MGRNGPLEGEPMPNFFVFPKNHLEISYSCPRLKMKGKNLYFFLGKYYNQLINICNCFK